MRISQERYLRLNPDGKVVEIPDEFSRRLAQAAAEERLRGPASAVRQAEALTRSHELAEADCLGSV